MRGSGCNSPGLLGNSPGLLGLPGRSQSYSVTAAIEAAPDLFARRQKEGPRELSAVICMRGNTAEWSPFHEVSSAQKPQRPLFRVSTYKPLVRRSIRDAYPPHMSKIHAPICPRCNQPMTWDRTIPAFRPTWPDLHSFYCDTCGHAETLAFLAQPTAGHSIAREAGAKN